MISRVAVLPQSPLLVPELMGAAAEEAAELRAACVRAARWLTDASSEWTALASEARAGREHAGTFRGYGVDVPVALSTSADEFDAELPLPALIAGWLRARAGATGVRVYAVEDGVPTVDTEALLVLGDGSNRHGLRSPGYQDDRAPGFDDAVASALTTADPTALRALDAGLAAELGAGGLPVWHALADLADGADWHGELLYSAAPFGVGYHVALWERR